MSDLQTALHHLRQAIEALPDNPTLDQISPLENQARDLLAQSKNTPYENEAREIFTHLARLSAPAQPSTINAESAQVRKLVRQARIRIEIAGDNQDYDAAIDILGQALELAPENTEIHDLLVQAAKRSSQHQLKVYGLAARYNLNLPLGQNTGQASPVAVSTPPASNMSAPAKPVEPIGTMSESETLLSEIASAYYAGDYNRTIDLANRLLVREPNNAQAAEYRQKSSDNIMRGVVPDHRIPFDARVAYNRANSLVRAGNYDEAQRLYREARDIAERAGIQSWKDVEQALLEIQDLALAREYLMDGDRLLMADDWSGARSKYEGSLRIVPNDPEVEERLVLVRKVQEQYEQASVQLSMLSGTLPEQADSLKRLFNTLSATRQILPGSERLQQTVYEVKTRMQQIKSQLIAQGENALNRLNSTSNAAERSKLAEQGVGYLQLAVDLDPSDTRALDLLQEASRTHGDLVSSLQTLDQAAAFIARNSESDLLQARQILVSLQGQAQDPRYRTLVDDLMTRYMDRMAEALDRKDRKMAERWLAVLKDEPFRILGRRTELLRLEDELRGQKQGRVAMFGVVGAIGIVFFMGALFLSRDAWYDSVFPPEPTATITLTASNTPPPSDTPTATGTPTVTSTATLEPDIQTATAGVTQTILGQTAVFVQRLTSDAQTAKSIYQATIIAQDRTATAAARSTEIQATNVRRTEEAQGTINYINTQTATFMPATLTPSLTTTPSLTPTSTNSPVLCRVTLTQFDYVNMRGAPFRGAPSIRLMLRNEEGDVVAQARDLSGETDNNGNVYIWYRVNVLVGTEIVPGWIRSDALFESPECPPLEE